MDWSGSNYYRRCLSRCHEGGMNSCVSDVRGSDGGCTRGSGMIVGVHRGGLVVCLTD